MSCHVTFASASPELSDGALVRSCQWEGLHQTTGDRTGAVVIGAEKICSVWHKGRGRTREGCFLVGQGGEGMAQAQEGVELVELVYRISYFPS